jgi:transposase
LMDRELRRPGVTRALLWEEYRAVHPLGFGYAWLSNRIASVKLLCKSNTDRAIWAR